jgi:hypothetical protein
MTFEENMTLWAAIAAVAKWVYEYTKRLSWDRNRFLLERIEKFRSMESTGKVQTMLDWNGANVELRGKQVWVDDEVLVSALQTHDVKGSFTSTEFAIRGLFDQYFDGLSELVAMSRSGLVDKGNLRLFMRYWIDILGGRRGKRKAVSDQFGRYMLFYGYEELHDFVAKTTVKEGLMNIIRKSE